MLKRRIVGFWSTKFIGKVVSSLIVQFSLFLQFVFPLGVVFKEWHLFVELLLVEDVISGLVLRPFVLHNKLSYWFSLDGASSGVELRLVGLLTGDELILLVKRMSQVMLRLGGCDFRSIWIGSLRELFPYLFV